MNTIKQGETVEIKDNDGDTWFVRVKKVDDNSICGQYKNDIELKFTEYEGLFEKEEHELIRKI